ncbi:MAG: ATP-binding cassette domain-containing protein [Reyranella sp.]|uniref:ATP-binding cassette domain-containing protein n=1 Tax=Reyranella sp. TaxID=1929291 RepID=UPI003D127E3E
MSGADLPIRFDNVTIATGNATMLDRVTFTISAGAPTVLIGPNGAGKTTLLRAAMGLVAPVRGTITWQGRDHVPPVRRAIVFQRPTMLRRSTAANIRYALRAARIARDRHDEVIDKLLALVGLEHAAERPARRLSAGEQQRLALARALARAPDVLFLDEPTASLDPASTKAIEDVIRTVSQRGIKVLLSTHDLGEARRLGGEVVLLHRGRVVEAAAAADFFESPLTDEARRFIAGELLV